MPRKIISNTKNPPSIQKKNNKLILSRDDDFWNDVEK